MRKVRGKFSLREVDRGFDQLGKTLAELRRKDSYVKVGIVGRDAAVARTDAEGLTNAELASVHEYGAPERGIPERSFIRAPFAANRQRYIQQLRGLLASVYRGKMTAERALGLMGATISADFKKDVTTGAGIPPPNAPSTVKAKGSSRPLIDTARMIGALTWAVVIGGSEKPGR